MAPSKPDMTEFLPRLFFGGLPSSNVNPLLKAGVTHMIATAEESQPAPVTLAPIQIVHAPVPSGRLTPEGVIAANKAAAIAIDIAKSNHRAKVLIYSWTGNDRAALVAALIYRHIMGCAGARAAQHIRKRREGALQWPSALAHLMHLGEKRSAA